MKILHITTHLNSGGISSYLYSLALGFKKRGHSIAVASSGGDIECVLSENGIEHIHIPIRTKNEISPAVLFSYLKLKKYLTDDCVDIIHAHTRVTQVLGLFLSKRLHIPMITTCHGFFKPRWHRKRFSCWGDKVIAISSQVKNHLISDFKVKEEDIYLIHSGIDLARFKAHSLEETSILKREIGIPQDYFVVGSSGRFSDVKGLEYLIKAMPYILQKKEKVTLLLVGYGKDEPRLRQIVKDLNLENTVIFYKPKSEMQDYLCVMNIFVAPSMQEGLGLSILEAQAQRIPVIASNIGGIPDIIQDYSSGILVKPKDVLAISSAVLKLMDDSGLYQKIKQNAYQKLDREFSLSKMIENTQEAYKELICHLK